MSSSPSRRARRAKGDKPEGPKKTAALTDNYHKIMGLFNGTWATLDLATDYAIYKFLNVTPGQAHLITSGMMFGRKARLLADLIGHSDHPQKAQVLGAFNKVRGDNKRDIFAHSYIRSGDNLVTFVDRSSSGEFKATEHTFTMLELAKHVHDFTFAVDASGNLSPSRSQKLKRSRWLRSASTAIPKLRPVSRPPVCDGCRSTSLERRLPPPPLASASRCSS